MKAWITGGDNGQLGHELARTVPDGTELVIPTQRIDIRDGDAVLAWCRHERPDCIVNAAAYTAVDKAETEPDEAAAVNDQAVRQLCFAAREVNARLLHVSTDFVFDGRAGHPYQTRSETSPGSVYGVTKLAGEQHVLSQLPGTGLIMRTAWVYSSHGNNFVKTMLRVLGERGEAGVVADQIGSPTWAHGLASALWRAAERDLAGIFHWTGAGVASWYDFAQAIAEEASALGLLPADVSVRPLRTDQYPTPARRPSYSVMETTGTWAALDLQPPHWRVELRSMLKELL